MRLVILCQKAMPWGILKSRIRMMEVKARKFHFCPCLGNQHWILFNWPWFLFIMIAMRSVTRRRRLLLCTVPPRRRQGVAVCMSAADTLIQNWFYLVLLRNWRYHLEIVLGSSNVPQPWNRTEFGSVNLLFCKLGFLPFYGLLAAFMAFLLKPMTFSE